MDRGEAVRGVPAAATLNGLDGVCHGAKIDFRDLLTKLSKATPKLLLLHLARQPEPFKTKAEEATACFKTGDGSQWLAAFLDSGRRHLQTLDRDAQGATTPQGIDQTLDPPIGGGGEQP